MALTPQTRASQAVVATITQIPADESLVSQAALATVVEVEPDVRVSQAVLVTIVRGRVDDPRVRAWTFTLDGHDYYVLRLGNNETLVYDVFSKQWYVWGSGDSTLWKAFTGTNWLAADINAAEYGSNILVGDDGNGSVYLLNPDGDFDDDTLEGADLPREFTRSVQGQVAVRGYSSKRAYGVEVEGSIGDATDENNITVNLSFSDDRGNTYVDAGSIDVPQGEHNIRLNWRSLGSISSPGRLYKITDYGALRRIDYLDSSQEE